MIKIFRFVDKVSGEERGICHSDKDGNSPINNPDWDVTEISEKDKEFYIEKQRQQRKQKLQQQENTHKKKANNVRAKLIQLGFNKDDVDEVIR